MVATLNSQVRLMSLRVRVAVCCDLLTAMKRRACMQPTTAGFNVAALIEVMIQQRQQRQVADVSDWKWQDGRAVRSLLSWHDAEPLHDQVCRCIVSCDCWYDGKCNDDQLTTHIYITKQHRSLAWCCTVMVQLRRSVV